MNVCVSSSLMKYLPIPVFPFNGLLSATGLDETRRPKLKVAVRYMSLYLYLIHITF